MRQSLDVRNKHVTFSHPEVDSAIGPLRIMTGADSIEWIYGLNTAVKPTLGGEVVQVLSAYVSDFKISGTTRSNDQLKQITDWFKKYMLVASLNGRNQTPVLFTYPERNWSLRIWVKTTPKLEYRTDLIAAPWEITAEIDGDPSLNELAEATRSRFTDSLSNPFFQRIGFGNKVGANALRLIDPHDPGNMSNDLDNIFDNIRRASATASSGDLSFLEKFDPLLDPDSQFGKSLSEIYAGIFGSDDLFGDSSTGSSTASGAIGNDRASIIAGIKHVFEENGIPGQLGVAVALQESTLNPDNRQDDGDYAMGLFQTFPAGRGGGVPNKAAVKKAFKRSGENDVTDMGYTAAMQIEDAATWFKAAAYGRTIRDKNDFNKMARWAQDAQAAGVDYTTDPRFRTNWLEAGRLIKEFGDFKTDGVAISEIKLTGSQLSDAILNHKRFNGVDGGSSGPAIGDIQDYKERGIEEKTLKIMLAIMNAGWNLHLSVIKTGHSPGTQHGRGKAFDVNNYGPTGAGSSGPGTSAGDDAGITRFVSFLKANRKSLGDIHILGGSPSARWGTDGADQNHHIHISWGAEGW